MADITYESDFDHQPWLAGDLVQAEGENGFNPKFNTIENEFNKLSATVSLINEQLNIALERGVEINAVASISKTNFQAGEMSEPEEIETYNNDDFPTEIRKLYQVSIEPIPFPPGANHGQISYYFIYERVSENMTKVSIWFRNERDQSTSFNALVFSIS